MGEYELWVDMNYGWIWIMGEYELWVNMNYGWTLGWIHHKRGGSGGGAGEENKLGF